MALWLSCLWSAVMMSAYRCAFGLDATIGCSIMRPGRISAFRADFGLILFDNASQSAPRRAYFRSGNVLEQPRLFACNSPGATFLHATRGSTLQVEVICTASAEKSQPAVTVVMLRGPDRADFVDLIQNVSKMFQRRFGGPVENVSKTFQKMLKNTVSGRARNSCLGLPVGIRPPAPQSRNDEHQSENPCQCSYFGCGYQDGTRMPAKPEPCG